MAARSLVVKADWNKISSKVNPDEISRLNKLKSKVNSNVTKASQLPEQLPKIDWSFYKTHASDPKLVEQLEKSYANLKVSPPKAAASCINDLEKFKKDDEARFEKFAEYAKSMIESAEVVKQKFMVMIPYEDMTVEDFTLTFPKWSWNRDNPTIFPHEGRALGLSKEEQIAFEQPEPLPYATPTAWKNWEIRKKKYYS